MFQKLFAYFSLIIFTFSSLHADYYLNLTQLANTTGQSATSAALTSGVYTGTTSTTGSTGNTIVINPTTGQATVLSSTGTTNLTGINLSNLGGVNLSSLLNFSGGSDWLSQLTSTMFGLTSLVSSLSNASLALQALSQISSGNTNTNLTSSSGTSGTSSSGTSGISSLNTSISSTSCGTGFTGGGPSSISTLPIGQSFTVNELTAYMPASQAQVEGSGLNYGIEGGVKDAYGNQIWGNTTYEAYVSGCQNYVTVAMDNQASLNGGLLVGNYLKSDQYAGIVFRVMDNGGYGNGIKGTSWMDIAYQDPEMSKSFKSSGVTFTVISAGEATTIASQRSVFK